MRPVLVGLAVAASLAISLIGAFGLGGSPSVAAQCDEEWSGTPCGDPTESELRVAREAELEWADSQNAWADTYLAAEKAEALYWREALVKLNPVTNKPVGGLVNMTTREVVRYPCDPNYDHAQSGGCVPADRDYDCWELRSWGWEEPQLFSEEVRAAFRSLR